MHRPMSELEKDEYELSIQDRKHAKKTSKWLLWLICLFSMAGGSFGLYKALHYIKSLIGL